MQFGFTLKPDHSIERTVALARQAEAAGFSYGWLFDSPRPVARSVPAADAHGPGDHDDAPRARASRTRRRASRPSPHRALAVLDECPADAWTSGSGAATPRVASSASRRPRWPHSRRRSSCIRDARRGASRSTYEGTDARRSRGPAGWTLPVWVAGYGPMALKMTGRVADGAILQLADPDLIRWFVGQIREAAHGAPAATRRTRSRSRRQRPPTSATSPTCRDRTRWFPALVEQPRRRSRQQVPARGPARVPDRLHPRPRRATTISTTPRSASSNAGFVGDEVTDRFCVLGFRRRRTSTKLRDLADAGVDQFNIYLMNGDEEEQLEVYGREIIPALRDVAAGTAD